MERYLYKDSSPKIRKPSTRIIPLNLVTAPVLGPAFGAIFWLVQNGGLVKIRAKRAFCMSNALSQVPKALEAHANFS